MNKKSEKILFEGNWISLKESTFNNNSGDHILWESVERKHSNLAVIDLACLVPSNRYILIKQFRIPINKYIIGFPAGLIHSAITDKKRLKLRFLWELKEKTGYIGRVTGSSPILKSGSGLINNSFKIFNVEVEEKALKILTRNNRLN